MFAPFSEAGIGLHTGRRVEALVEMGLPGTGIVFFANGLEIPARPESIAPNPQRATTLECEGTRITTVEHLLAALAAFGETDVRVHVDGDELPILDGSAILWAEALSGSGAKPGPSFVRVTSPVRVDEGASSAHLEPLDPASTPRIHVVIDFDRNELPRQEYSFAPGKDDFRFGPAFARTFAFADEVPSLREQELAGGGSLDNALVIGSAGPLNPEGMRAPDEPARHKLLDAMGDLMLLGGLPWAEVTLVRPGHRLLHELVRRTAPLLEGQ